MSHFYSDWALDIIGGQGGTLSETFVYFYESMLSLPQDEGFRSLKASDLGNSLCSYSLTLE